MRMSLVSIIVPCYNEEESLPLFYRAISNVQKSISEYSFEILFVDDGSKDNTLSIIKNLAQKNSDIKYISFSRNFGKEAAIYAGLKASSGDYVAIMDADLQDPPQLLPQMLRYITEEHYDSVATRRVTRKGEPPIRSFFARCFYKLINKISKTEIVDGARDYRLMTRQFVNSLISMKSFFKRFIWVGWL